MTKHKSLVDPNRKQNGDLAANSSKASQNTNGSDSTDALQSENEWSSSSMAYDPHLCIMYTLYRESALYINIYDYYTAFMSVIKQPQDEDDPLFERKALAWFCRVSLNSRLLVFYETVSVNLSVSRSLYGEIFRCRNVY